MGPLSTSHACYSLCSSSMRHRLWRSRGTNPTPDRAVQWAATLSATGGVKRKQRDDARARGEILDGWHVYDSDGGATGRTDRTPGHPEMRMKSPRSGHSVRPGSPQAPRPELRPPNPVLHAFIYRSRAGTGETAARRRPQNLPVSVRFQTCSDRECQRQRPSISSRACRGGSRCLITEATVSTESYTRALFTGCGCRLLAVCHACAHRRTPRSP